MFGPLGRKIANGSYGQINAIAGSNEYVVKTIQKEDDPEFEEILALLAVSGRPNVIELLAYEELETRILLYFERYAYCLQTLLDGGKTLSWSARQGLCAMYQMANGVKACHDQLLVHCDIKPSNILLKDDGLGGFYIVLADFGLCLPSEMVIKRDVHPIGYRGPEHTIPPVDGYYYITTSADIWALGSVFCDVIISGNYAPCQHLKDYQVWIEVFPNLSESIVGREPVRRHQRLLTMIKRKGYPTGFRSLLLEGILAKDPEVRFSVETVLKMLASQIVELEQIENGAVLDEEGLAM